MTLVFSHGGTALFRFDGTVVSPKEMRGMLTPLVERAPAGDLDLHKF